MLSDFNTPTSVPAYALLGSVHAVPWRGLGVREGLLTSLNDRNGFISRLVASQGCHDSTEGYQTATSLQTKHDEMHTRVSDNGRQARAD